MSSATNNSSGATTNYTYNALGQRMEVSMPSLWLIYPFDPWGNETGWFNGDNGWWATYKIFVLGRPVRMYASTAQQFFHQNHLGSVTMITDAAGTVEKDHLFYRWGEEWTSEGMWWSKRFAGMETPLLGTDLYRTDFRLYSANQGRWVSPDPVAGSILNPQSLNRYAYAGWRRPLLSGLRLGEPARDR